MGKGRMEVERKPAEIFVSEKFTQSIVMSREFTNDLQNAFIRAYAVTLKGGPLEEGEDPLRTVRELTGNSDAFMRGFKIEALKFAKSIQLQIMRSTPDCSNDPKDINFADQPTAAAIKGVMPFVPFDFGETPTELKKRVETLKEELTKSVGVELKRKGVALVPYKDAKIPEGHYPVSFKIGETTDSATGKTVPTIEVVWAPWIEAAGVSVDYEARLGAVPKKRPV